MDRTQDELPIRILTIEDEHARECLSFDVTRRLNSESVPYGLTALFVHRGTIRCISGLVQETAH
jgi:hypothetical protein